MVSLVLVRMDSVVSADPSQSMPFCMLLIAVVVVSAITENVEFVSSNVLFDVTISSKSLPFKTFVDTFSIKSITLVVFDAPSLTTLDVTASVLVSKTCFNVVFNDSTVFCTASTTVTLKASVVVVAVVVVVLISVVVGT